MRRQGLGGLNARAVHNQNDSQIAVRKELVVRCKSRRRAVAGERHAVGGGANGHGRLPFAVFMPHWAALFNTLLVRLICFDGLLKGRNHLIPILRLAIDAVVEVVYQVTLFCGV